MKIQFIFCLKKITHTCNDIVRETKDNLTEMCNRETDRPQITKVEEPQHYLVEVLRRPLELWG